MSKFETKSYQIEASQWFKADDHPAVKAGAVINGEKVPPRVRTRQGWVAVDPGDWIITLPDGETYPCKPDVFEAKYRPVAKGGTKGSTDEH